MKKIIAISICLFLSACTNENDADRSLISLGFTNITYTGFRLFACADSDFYHTGFKAINPQGNKVSGTVCSGILFKNSTVRFS